MEMWISRYALTCGVRLMVGRINETISTFIVTSDPFHFTGKIGVDCHRTEEAAKAAAESMRVKKIASLRKQISKLEGMKF